MLKQLKETTRAALQRCGLDVKRHRRGAVGEDAFADMEHYIKRPGFPPPVIFDVGANVGQTAERFLAHFPDARIHCFEPGPAAFRALTARVGVRPGVKLWNVGVGSAAGLLPFHENAQSVMSSFLEPAAETWGQTERVTNVPVTTLDDFAAKNGVGEIGILKSDTQGFELEVFKGATGLLESGRIALVYFEVTFADLYKDAPPFHTLFRHLAERGYRLLGIYEPVYEYDLAAWTDVLFIHRGFYRAWAADRPGWSARV